MNRERVKIVTSGAGENFLIEIYARPNSHYNRVELSVSQLYICDELLMALQAIFYVIENIHDSLNPVQGMELQEKEQKRQKDL